jgi:VCBS repeat-containing protein
MSITAVNGSASLVGTDIAGTYGTLHVNSDGSYSYTANAAFDQLQGGDNPTEQYNITVTNSLNQSETTTLTFNFFGTDDAPVITAADDVGVLTEDAGPTTAVNGGFETGDLTGWSASGVLVEPLFLGNEFGTYTAQLTSGSLEQDISTVAGQHYTLTFEVAGDPDATSSGLNVFWDGAQILGQADPGLGFTKYTFDVVGDATHSTTQLLFDFGTDGSGMLLDAVSVSPTPGPAVETTAGSIAFSDVETTDTHTASFVPTDVGYVGTFSLDPVSETAGHGTVAWHFSVDNADIQFLAQNQTLSQVYAVTVIDSNGASAVQDVTVAINGTNDAPNAVGETVVTDAGANGTVDIPGWALALNDTDPDATDHVSFSNTVSASGGSAPTAAGDAFFIDDSTPGGSFTYQSTDGIATGNAATATIVNNATNASTLTAAGSGDSILIATNSTEALNGGSGNDILIGNSGSHVMSGGAGNDTFAFLQTTDGPGIITDFNNTTEHDHIAIAANGFGGGLTAGMDVSSTFETTADNQFSGAAEFHFDTANQTLYFSADGSQANAHAVTSVQAGVVLNPHDILIV